MKNENTDKPRVSPKLLSMMRAQKRMLARMSVEQKRDYNLQLDREASEWLRSNPVSIIAAGRAMGTMDCRSLGIEA